MVEKKLKTKKKAAKKNVPAIEGHPDFEQMAEIISAIAKLAIPPNQTETEKAFLMSPAGRQFLLEGFKAVIGSSIPEIKPEPGCILINIPVPKISTSILPAALPPRGPVVMIPEPPRIPSPLFAGKEAPMIVIARPGDRVSEVPLLDLSDIQERAGIRGFFDPGPADDRSWPAKGDKPNAVEDLLNSSSLTDIMDLHSQAQDSASPFGIPKGEIAGSIREADNCLPALPDDEEKHEFIAGMVREQEEMARMFFPEKIEAGIISTEDFKDLKVPPRLAGKHIHRLFVLPKGFDALEAWKSVAKHTRFGQRAGENEFVWSIISKRSSASASYVFWADERLNCDRALEKYSLREIKVNRLPTMTFEERCWHDLYHLFLALKRSKLELKDYDSKMFGKLTGKHFLFDESTLCLDSRVNGHNGILTYMRCSSVLSLKLLDPSVLSEGKNSDPEDEHDLPEEDRRRPSIHASPPRAHRVSAEFAPINPDFAPKPAF